ncbi:hypothetical protein LXL04_009647 [Taraxacum kok-saghyz]
MDISIRILTLLKAYLDSIEIYYMSIFRMPVAFMLLLHSYRAKAKEKIVLNIRLAVWPHVTRWNKFVLIKCNIFGLTLALNRLPITAKLENRGIELDSSHCLVGSNQVEKLDYQFFSCTLALQMWLKYWRDVLVVECFFFFEYEKFNYGDDSFDSVITGTHSSVILRSITRRSYKITLSLYFATSIKTTLHFSRHPRHFLRHLPRHSPGVESLMIDRLSIRRDSGKSRDDGRIPAAVLIPAGGGGKIPAEGGG